MPGSHRLRVVVAFAVIYVVWGCTYLAIRVAVETIPPMLMTGSRFAVAGLLLLAWLALRRANAPRGSEWRLALAPSLLLIVATYAPLTWGEQYVASSVAALIAATVPLWFVVARTIATRRLPPAVVLAGVALGTVAQAILVAPRVREGSASAGWAIAAIFACVLAWVAGTLVAARRTIAAERAATDSALQMLVGGVLLLAIGVALGEHRTLDLRAVSARSFWSWLYLVIPGSLLGFSAYVWLLRHASPERVGTYAYVNPIVAVMAGALLGGERIGVAAVVATVLTVVAVAMTLRGEHAERAERAGG